MEMNEDLIEMMLEKGYIEIVGHNAVGDPLYRITELFYKEQADLVEWMRKADSDILNELWFKNFIDLKMDEKGNAYVYLTNKSETWTEAEELSEEEKAMMYLIYSTGAYFGADLGQQERD